MTSDHQLSSFFIYITKNSEWFMDNDWSFIHRFHWTTCWWCKCKSWAQSRYWRDDWSSDFYFLFQFQECLPDDTITCSSYLKFGILKKWCCRKLLGTQQKEVSLAWRWWENWLFQEYSCAIVHENPGCSAKSMWGETIYFYIDQHQMTFLQHHSMLCSWLIVACVCYRIVWMLSKPGCNDHDHCMMRYASWHELNLSRGMWWLLHWWYCGSMSWWWGGDLLSLWSGSRGVVMYHGGPW